MSKLVTSADMRRIGQAIKKMIETRTKSGVSENGTTFKPKQDGSKSNLVDTGRLLKSLKISVKGDKVTVEPNDDYARYVDRERPFMGLTEEEMVRVEDMLEETIQKNLQDLITKEMNRQGL